MVTNPKRAAVSDLLSVSPSIAPFLLVTLFQRGNAYSRGSVAGGPERPGMRYDAERRNEEGEGRHLCLYPDPPFAPSYYERTFSMNSRSCRT